MEINTKHFLYQSVCKTLLCAAEGTVIAVVMWISVLYIFCTRLYVKTLPCAAEGIVIAVVMWKLILNIFVPDSI